MKRLSFFIIAIFLLTACSSGGDLQAGKPRIPSAKKPSLPSLKNLQANLLGSADNDEVRKELDMERLLEDINKNLELPNITADDIDRGWYYGKRYERKFGTPNSWEWVDDARDSRWVSPNATVIIEDITDDELCRKTAGSYVISCIEREVPFCEYITESKCECIEGTRWVDKQGCIIVNDQDLLVRIGSDELRKGWYFGLPNERKLNTPLSWVWVENGKESKWQNKPPIE